MTIALVGQGSSTWLETVASRCAGDCVRLELESALHAGALTIDDERVLWDGFDLLGAQAVLLERPVFAWPQSGVGAPGLSPRAGREARALLLSALHIVARSVRVLDPPASAHLAVAPLSALDRCEQLGLPVQPWELVTQRPDSDERIWLDAAGADVWLAACTPVPGQPAWSPEPFADAVLSILTIGSQVVGARRFTTPTAWGAAEHDGRLAASELSDSACAVALAAQRSLELSWLQTDLVEACPRSRILRVVPGVELGPWERDLEGGASAALAALLTNQTP